jgi:hypothetical protein
MQIENLLKEKVYKLDDYQHEIIKKFVVSCNFVETIYLNYYIDKTGFVLNLSRTYNTKRVCKQYKDKDGYLRVWVKENGKRKFVPVHRLVAFAFLERILGKEQVNHISGNKSNNYYANLEWCTNLENERHSRKILGKKNVVGVDSGRSKLTEKQVLEIRKSTCKNKDITIKYCISDAQVRRIKNKTNWSHI